MRVLVIGGTGFIGSATARHLAYGGHEVHVVHRGNTPATLPSSVRARTVDRDDVTRLSAVASSIKPAVTIDCVSYTWITHELWSPHWRSPTAGL